MVIINNEIIMRKSKRLGKMVLPPLGFRLGKWSEEEHELMFRFVKSQRKELISYLKSNLIDRVRCNKKYFFSRMAAFIKTKTDRQCKSRFQKQELRLMRALRLPHKLLDSLEQLRGRIVVLQDNPMMSTPRTDAPLTDDKVDLNRSEAPSINTLKALTDVMRSDLMPKIPNDPLRSFTERFIRSVPSDLREISEFPSHFFHFTGQIPWQINISSASARNRPDSFFED